MVSVAVPLEPDGVQTGSVTILLPNPQVEEGNSISLEYGNRFLHTSYHEEL